MVIFCMYPQSWLHNALFILLEIPRVRVHVRREEWASSVETSVCFPSKTIQLLLKKTCCTAGKKASRALKTCIDLEQQPLKNLHFWIGMQLLQTYKCLTSKNLLWSFYTYRLLSITYFLLHRTLKSDTLCLTRKLAEFGKGLFLLVVLLLACIIERKFC